MRCFCPKYAFHCPWFTKEWPSRSRWRDERGRKLRNASRSTSINFHWLTSRYSRRTVQWRCLVYPSKAQYRGGPKDIKQVLHVQLRCSGLAHVVHSHAQLTRREWLSKRTGQIHKPVRYPRRLPRRATMRASPPGQERSDGVGDESRLLPTFFCPSDRSPVGPS